MYILEVGEVRSSVCNCLEVVDREVNVGCTSHCEKMEDLKQHVNNSSVHAGGLTRTEFVEPPRMLTIAIALRNDWRVTMSLHRGSASGNAFAYYR